MRPTYNLDKKLSEALERAFLALGWYRWSGCWAKEPSCTNPSGPRYYIYDTLHTEHFFKGAVLEDLPRLLLQEQRGKDIFGRINWEQVLPVLQRVLQL